MSLGNSSVREKGHPLGSRELEPLNQLPAYLQIHKGSWGSYNIATKWRKGSYKPAVPWQSHEKRRKEWSITHHQPQPHSAFAFLWHSRARQG